MIKRYSFKSGFSLIEVMISFLILSIIMVALAPVVTKKISIGRRQGVVYTYRDDNRTNTDDVCFTTTVNYNGFNETYTATNDCSEYQFTVPDGVRHVNLTLVAGGGGGGGAAGGLIDKGSYNILNGIWNLDLDLLSSLRIDYLTSEGEAGENTTTSLTCAGGSYCGGKGGNSSSYVITNYTLPEPFNRGGIFTNSLDVDDIPQGTLAIATGGAENSITVSSTILEEQEVTEASVTTKTEIETNQSVRYALDETSANGYACQANTITNTTTTTTNGTAVNVQDASGDEGSINCPAIPAANRRGGFEGQYGSYINDGVGGIFLSGGAGGKNPYTQGHGDGGNGVAIKLTDNGGGGFSISKAYTDEVAATVAAPGAPGASVTFTTENPGGAGGGGAAGAVIRIVGFPVTPGDTYTIRVGKGGNGGAAGISSETTPIEGSNGEGGVSTAIYNADGNLVFMVNGGSPGQGGQVFTGADYTGEIGISGRNQAKVFYGNDFADDVVRTDTSLMTTEAAIDNRTPNDAPGYGAQLALVYPALDEEPYNTLSLNTENAADNRYGGFENFDADFHDTTAPQFTNVTLNDNALNNVYDGFYYRALVKMYAVTVNEGEADEADVNYYTQAAYVGGLGGFNGLGGKAGCGGYFLGNFDGRGNNGNLFDVLKHKFILDNIAYDVFQYYDNCTITSPNGQTAKFVMPKASSLNFGQAGAGGGGGGWNVSDGAGSGGAGQNGYLMIDWRN